MYSSEGPAPAGRTAFEHPETRAAWEKTRRRVRGRFLLWSLLCVALLTVGIAQSATAETDYARRGDNQLGPAISALAVLWYPFVLYTCLGAFSRLKQARSVLEACPWQPLPAVWKVSGRETAGVLVRLPVSGEAAPGRAATEGRLSKEGAHASASGPPGHGGAGAGDGEWSPTMSARDPRRWNRWDERLERGAWFAGDPCRWGVLALPGGEGLMTVQRSSANLSGERTTAKQDRERVLAEARRG